MSHSPPPLVSEDAKTFSFHADPELTRRVVQRAQSEDRTVSSLIRVALRRYLAHAQEAAAEVTG